MISWCGYLEADNAQGSLRISPCGSWERWCTWPDFMPFHTSSSLSMKGSANRQQRAGDYVHDDLKGHTTDKKHQKLVTKGLVFVTIESSLPHSCCFTDNVWIPNNLITLLRGTVGFTLATAACTPTTDPVLFQNNVTLFDISNKRSTHVYIPSPLWL